MQELESKIKSWYKNIKEPKISFERKGIRPTKDWHRILFSSFFMLITLGLLAWYFYREVDGGTFFAVPNEEMSSEVKINNVLLKKVIDDIDYRANRLMEIRRDRKTSNNPSL